MIGVPFLRIFEWPQNRPNFSYYDRNALKAGEIMIVGKVVGSLIATRKNENLIGSKFLIVQPLASMQGAANRMVAVDHVGAGIGETVLVAQGSAARIGCGLDSAPVDAAIVGIVDDGIGLDDLPL